MPYRVPDTFFDDMENIIITKARSQRHRHLILRIIYRNMAVAAVLALLFVIGDSRRFQPANDISEITQAFDNLSDIDQSYLLETYNDDIFINE